LLDGRDVTVHGSGRTDAGVHAKTGGQRFSATRNESAKLRNAINGNLAKDIRVLFVDPVPDDFHARYSARSKTYVIV